MKSRATQILHCPKHGTKKHRSKAGALYCRECRTENGHRANEATRYTHGPGRVVPREPAGPSPDQLIAEFQARCRAAREAEAVFFGGLHA